MAHGIYLLLIRLQLLRDLIRLLEILEVTLHEVDYAGVAELFEFLHCFLSVFLFLGDKDDFRCTVFEQMGGNSKAYARCAACDNVDL